MVMGIRNYMDLIVWQKAMDLVQAVYAVTKDFLRRSFIALPVNSEKPVFQFPQTSLKVRGRESKQEFLHHLSIAHGSIREVETQLQIAMRLDYLSESNLNRLMALASEVGRLINGLSNSMRRKK